MVRERSEQGRTRAWVLVHTEEGQAQEVSDRIMALNERLKDLYPDADNPSFVIRADVVVGLGDLPYSIVAPVDLVSQDALQTVIQMTQELPGVKEQVAALVEVHNPYPPHRTLGYVTGEEAEADPKKEEETQPGLRGNSPGENPWG
jgi:hypothetical protein